MSLKEKCKAWVIDIVTSDYWDRIPPKNHIIALGLVFIYMSYGMWTSGWVIPLDHVSLAIHEAGHPIIGMLFGHQMTVYGGTIFQLLFPLLFAAHFVRHEQPLGFCFALAWESSSIHAMARYMSDARAKALPLVGGGGGEDAHDWGEIFSRWGLLNQDIIIGDLMATLSWVVMIFCFSLLFSLWRKSDH